MPGTTTSKRAVVARVTYEAAQVIIHRNGRSFRDLGEATQTGQLVVTRALGGPPRKSTESERRQRVLIETVIRQISNEYEQVRLRRLVAFMKIPPEAFRCFPAIISTDDELWPVFSDLLPKVHN